MILYLNIIFELCCLCFAVFTLRSVKAPWTFFILYLLSVVGIETYGLYTAQKHLSSNIIYNVYVFINFFFVQMILYRIGNLNSTGKVPAWFFSVLFLLFYVGELLYNGFREFTQTSIVLSNILITIQCLYYFYSLMKQDHFVQLKTYAPFWIVAGLLIHAFGSTASFLFYGYLVAINKELNIPVRQIIFLFLNFILYSSWSYAFVCKYQQRISS